MSGLVDRFRRDAGAIESLVGDGGSFIPDSETPSALQVERGMVFPIALRTPSALDRAVACVDRLIAEPSADTIVVIDRRGHQRPVYRPLLVYCWLRAYRLLYETLPREVFSQWDDALRTWCDDLERRLSTMPLPDTDLPAARGDGLAATTWTALTLSVAGDLFVRDAWTDLAAETFGRLARHQQPNGAFLLARASDNPEPIWYHELILLHAAASYAVQREDRAVAAAVKRASEFHQSETQPDHATTQPWAVFAFLWNEPTRPLAEQVLHGMQVQHPTGATGVPLMLLADALYCLRLFL